MAGLNKVLLIGNLTRDPEIRYSQSGNAVANFSIATNESWRDQQGQKQERVEFHRLVVFGKQAETCEKYLTKGSQIYVEGRLQTRSWEKDGQTHYTTEIVVSNFQFLGDGHQGQGNQNQTTNQSQSRNQGGYQQQGRPQGQPQQPGSDQNYQYGSNRQREYCEPPMEDD